MPRLSVYILWVFDKCIHLCSPNLYQDTEHNNSSTPQSPPYHPTQFPFPPKTIIVILWLVRNIYLVFILVSGTKLLGPMAFPLMTVINLLFVMLMRWFGHHLRMVAGCQWSQPGDARVGTFSLTSWPPGQGEGLKNWFSHQCLMI